MSEVFQQSYEQSRNPFIEMLPLNVQTMRAQLTSVFLCMMFFGVLLVPTLNPASARSVHETAEYDLFPQGELTNPADWSLQATTSFTSQPATYTDTMVADQRITTVSYTHLTLPTKRIV